MSGTRLVSKADTTEFPYEAAKDALLAMPAMNTGRVDFDRMIEVGKRIGWSKEMLEAHEALRASGRCFTFRQNQPPWLQGTLFEDNVFFDYADSNQEVAARAVIIELARTLDVRMIEY
jgi:hypothetical protein